MDDAALLEKLRKIEALFAGASTDGERQAARNAAEKIEARLRERESVEPVTEFRCTLRDAWSKKLFAALCRRYGLTPYRYARQRQTTMMVRVPKSFMDQVMWPEFQALSKELSKYLAEVTDRVIHGAIHADTSDAEILEEPKLLGQPGSD